MRKIALIILLNIACSAMSGQYSYFDNVSSQSYLNGVEGTSNIEVFEDHYITWGIGVDSVQYRYFIQKYDLDGNFVEGKNYYFPNEYIFTGLTRSFLRIENGFVSGVTRQNDNGIFGLVMKFNSELDTIWTKTYDFFPSETVFHSISKSESGFLLNGSYGSSVDQRGTYLAEIDENGELLWNSIIHPPQQGVFRNRNVTKSIDGFAVSGSMGAGAETVGRIEFLNENGEYQSHLQGNGGITQFAMIHQPIDGETILASQAVVIEQLPGYPDITFSYVDLKLYEIDLNTKSIINEHTFFEGENFARGNIIKTLKSSDGDGWVFSGPFSRFYGGFRNKSFIMKTDSLYNLEWFTEFAQDTCLGCTNTIWDMEIAPDGGYVMVGEVQGVNGNPYEHTWLVKVDACGDLEFNGCWPVGVNEIEMQSMQLNAYPNPAKDYIAIEFQNWREELILTMVDMNGKIIFSKKVNPTGIELIDISAYSSGMYQIIAKSVKTGQVNSLKIEVQH